MWRHQALCEHCGQATSWERDRDKSLREITGHLRQVHQVTASQESQDYRVARQRQCDYCLEPYLDHCTKCTRDFCTLHAGDIDGLCGGCI